MQTREESVGNARKKYIGHLTIKHFEHKCDFCQIQGTDNLVADHWPKARGHRQQKKNPRAPRQKVSLNLEHFPQSVFAFAILVGTPIILKRAFCRL